MKADNLSISTFICKQLVKRVGASLGLAAALGLSLAPAQEQPTEATQHSKAAETGWKNECIKLIRRGDKEAETELKALLLPLAESGDATAQLLLFIRNNESSWLDKAAAQEDADALWIQGIEMAPSPECMKKWEKAAEAGHIGARWELAYESLYGNIRKTNSASVVCSEKQCLELALEGHVMAQRAMANYHHNDSSFAEEWFRKAAEQGDVEAMYRLGYILREQSGGVAEDESEESSSRRSRSSSRRSSSRRAEKPQTTRSRQLRSLPMKSEWEKWMQTSADRGYPIALNDIAKYLMERNMNPELDISQLKPYFKVSREYAMSALERLSYISLLSDMTISEDFKIFGSGQDKEYVSIRMEGVRTNDAWAKIEALANKGHVPAMYDMGVKEEMLMESDSERKSSHREAAVNWYRQILRSKHVSAHLRLGTLLESQAKSAKEAVKMYKFAADKGESYAKYRLGRCYLLGIGTEANPKKAYKCFSEAAECWDGGGLYELAMCYYDGCGVAKDRKKAQECINRYVMLFGVCSRTALYDPICTTWHIKDARNMRRLDLDGDETAAIKRDAICLYLLLRQIN